MLPNSYAAFDRTPHVGELTPPDSAVSAHRPIGRRGYSRPIRVWPTAAYICRVGNVIDSAQPYLSATTTLSVFINIRSVRSVDRKTCFPLH